MFIPSPWKPPLTNSHNLTRQLDELRRLNVELRHQLELAELIVPQTNSLISQLVGIELITEVALLGEVIYDMAYAPVSGGSDGSLLLQAAILVPGGVGLVLWDREEFLAILDNIGPEYQEVRLRFCAFEELGSALKAMLLPHVELLLRRLILRVMPVQMRQPPAASG